MYIGTSFGGLSHDIWKVKFGPSVSIVISQLPSFAVICHWRNSFPNETLSELGFPVFMIFPMFVALTVVNHSSFRKLCCTHHSLLLFNQLCRSSKLFQYHRTSILLVALFMCWLAKFGIDYLFTMLVESSYSFAPNIKRTLTSTSPMILSGC